MEDALAAVECGVDILGFNFYEPSPRYISPDETKGIIKELPFFTGTVGILVKPKLRSMQQTVERSGVAALQIYEPIDEYTQCPMPIIFCIRMQDGVIPDIVIHSDMVLLDTFSTSLWGGTGKQFDWSAIPDTIPRERLILSGGINVDNIEDALRQVRPAVIDVASGAESAPGKKDAVKMRCLVDKVREFNLEN